MKIPIVQLENSMKTDSVTGTVKEIHLFQGFDKL